VDLHRNRELFQAILGNLRKSEGCCMLSGRVRGEWMVSGGGIRVTTCVRPLQLIASGQQNPLDPSLYVWYHGPRALARQ